MSDIPPESTTKLLLRNKPLLVSQAMAFTSPAGLTTFPVCPACMATLEREGQNFATIADNAWIGVGTSTPRSSTRAKISTQYSWQGWCSNLHLKGIEIFNKSLDEQKEPKNFISKDNAQLSDSNELESIIDNILNNNTSQVEAYKNGKLIFLITLWVK